MSRSKPIQKTIVIILIGLAMILTTAVSLIGAHAEGFLRASAESLPAHLARIERDQGVSKQCLAAAGPAGGRSNARLARALAECYMSGSVEELARGRDASLLAAAEKAKEASEKKLIKAGEKIEESYGNASAKIGDRAGLAYRREANAPGGVRGAIGAGELFEKISEWQLAAMMENQLDEAELAKAMAKEAAEATAKRMEQDLADFKKAEQEAEWELKALGAVVSQKNQAWAREPLTRLGRLQAEEMWAGYWKTQMPAAHARARAEMAQEALEGKKPNEKEAPWAAFGRERSEKAPLPLPELFEDKGELKAAAERLQALAK